MDAQITELVTTVERLMRPYTGTWALCGGWAIDSWLNRVTRDHEDLDIAVWMYEQSLFHAELADWRLVAHETEEADHQVLWDGHSLAPATHVHAGQDLVPRRELRSLVDVADDEEHRPEDRHHVRDQAAAQHADTAPGDRQPTIGEHGGHQPFQRCARTAEQVPGRG